MSLFCYQEQTDTIGIRLLKKTLNSDYTSPVTVARVLSDVMFKHIRITTYVFLSPASVRTCILFILRRLESVWNLFFQDLLDTREACQRPRGDITQYQISFQTGSVVATENVNIARCTAGRCSHTFEPPSNPPSSYDSVSVAAENVVGVGAARTCTTQPIGEFNFYSCIVVSQKVSKVEARYKSVNDGGGHSFECFHI